MKESGKEGITDADRKETSDAVLEKREYKEELFARQKRTMPPADRTAGASAGLWNAVFRTSDIIEGELVQRSVLSRAVAWNAV